LKISYILTLSFAIFIAQYYAISLTWLLIIGFISSLLIGFYFIQWRYISFFLAGLIWASGYQYFIQQPLLASEYEGENILVQGFVQSLPQQDRFIQKFEFHIESASLDQKNILIPNKIRLSWYYAKKSVKAGEHWQFIVRLKRPHGFKNPVGFDYENWLLKNNIGAVGYIYKSKQNQYLPEKTGHYLLKWRQATKDHIQKVLGESDSSAILSALTLGDKSNISTEQWQKFQQLGINHLVAISGLHIGMIATFAWFLFYQFWARFAVLCYFFPAQKASAIFALMIALLYTLFSGFDIPSRRAFVMLVIVLGGVLFNHPLKSLHTLAIAFLAVILLEPNALFSVGFWLSFGAVFAIIYILSGRLAPFGFWTSLIKVQIAISFLLLPLLLGWFGTFSVIAPFINPFAVLWTTWLVIPCSFLGLVISFIFNNDFILQGANKLIQLGLNLVDIISAWQWGVVKISALPFWCLLGLSLAGLLFLLPRAVIGRWLAPIFCLPAFFYQVKAIDLKEIQFTLLDVGQGLAMVIETHQHTLVYDLGPRYSKKFNTAEAVVLPYLAQRQIKQVDLLVLSNADADHAGAYPAFLQKIPVSVIRSGEPEEIKAVDVKGCHQDLTWYWDQVKFQILTINQQHWLKNNDASCVLLIQNNHFKILLTGDISKKIENALIKKYPVLNGINFMQVAHHGSKTSSSSNFIKATQAQYALFSTGYRNKFGFPKKSVVDRWKKQGAILLNTSQAGAVQFTTHNNTFIFKHYRTKP